MAATLSTTLQLRVLLISLYCLLYLHASSIGFRSPLIKLNSVRSPYYNPNLTISDRIQAAVRASYARERYIEPLQSNMYQPSETDTGIWGEVDLYMMEYYVGSSAVRSYGIIDTGSRLVWLQCLPCEKCFKQSIPVFDPQQSDTFHRYKCDDPMCRLMPQGSCTSDGYCRYEASYVDGSYSRGDAASEALYFHDGEGHTFIWEGTTIGCAHNSQFGRIKEPSRPPGIIGLSRSPISLIMQASTGPKRFAYCFGDRGDSTVDGYIKFHDAVSLEGSPTPILTVGGPYSMRYNTLYFMSLEGLSVGNTRLPLHEDTFTYKPEVGKGGFIIDSGTTLTYLNRTAFDILANALDEKLGRRHFRAELPVCYSGEPHDFERGPHITFHFTGVDLTLDTWSQWKIMDHRRHCLTMLPTDRKSKFGNYQQQNMEVAYDLESLNIYFNKLSCSNLAT